MNPPPFLFAPLLALASLGCATDGRETQIAEKETPEHRIYRWDDDGGSGRVKVRINLTTQRAYFTRGGRPIGWSYVATGKEGRDTPAGTFHITEKIVDKYSNRYGWIENAYGHTIDDDASPGDPVPSGARYVAAPMPYWMRLTSYGIGMHAGIIPRPGTPASHGCIRLPKPLAPLLFNAVDIGTPVVIEYGASVSGEVHPEPLPQDDPTTERRINGLRVVSPDDPWIVWPPGHPFAR